MDGLFSMWTLPAPSPPPPRVLSRIFHGLVLHFLPGLRLDRDVFSVALAS